MSDTSNHLPQRLISLVVSIFICLASGTPYLYGVYSPQLVQRVGLTTSDSATISLASNIGSGVGGLPGGLMIDHFGPQISILVGSICIFIGYFVLYKIYQHKYDSLFFICISIAAMGFGSITSYFATLKAAQANFPKHRGAAGAFPVSSYGLSATLFSVIAATFFKDNTGGLLEFLAMFCGIVAFLGSFFIHIYLDHEDEEPDIESHKLASSEEEAAMMESSNSSPTVVEEIEQPGATAAKLERSDSLPGSFRFWGLGSRTPRSSVSSSQEDMQPILQNIRDQNRLQQQSSSTNNNNPFLSPPRTSFQIIKDRLTDKIFLTHYFIVSIISGMGQTYIYTVGFIVTAQYYYHKDQLDSVSTVDTTPRSGIAGVHAKIASSAAALQALQVSIISIGSFSGRLFSGFVSDFIHKKYHIQRLWIVVVTIIILSVGQFITITNVNSAHLISISSAIIGGSYGLVFGTYPAVVADSFGTKTFSTTWGLICTGPLITLFFLNKYFGYIYDANTDSKTGICYKGNECYKGAYELSFLLCFVVFITSLVIIYVQRKKQ
ncbi:Monocarboxylate transporter [Scheffersomyces stipitis CBS 6054]|uniref:Monocarboxylate transporter n=1 Tax=Scheffersomyces stipitis (strain ATCC 58785 / CBS 6054 / NBRC 10063 / NRRL Y-11545) TaxID=322104 RepID=A3LS56_PICST|nr:Monocarboxylate transporter [Scheffersomyces stipitis CBS 6054]ABN65506.2 Monocarboxylate transporter [Scheffersomyces stipitis CBS 6054]